MSLLLILIKFHTLFCSGVLIFDFEQENAAWECYHRTIQRMQNDHEKTSHENKIKNIISVSAEA